MIKSFIIFIFSTLGVYYLLSYILHLGSSESVNISVSSFIQSLSSLNSSFDFELFFGNLLSALDSFTSSCDSLSDQLKDLGNLDIVELFKTMGAVVYSFGNTFFHLIYSIGEYLIYLVGLFIKIIKFLFS